MKKKPRSESHRTQRRTAERQELRLLEDRERLFRLSPGGRPEHPISVSSASVVEAHAKQMQCPQCGASQRVMEHSARHLGSARLRQVELTCSQCGTRRSVFFRIDALPN